ncbi:hypothetical protein GCM10023080_080340 [Streptomyces pseudoechinosporeus]
MLGAMNAWTAQEAGDYDSLSTALCLCACAVGLFGEDLLQSGYRRASGSQDALLCPGPLELDVRLGKPPATCL